MERVNYDQLVESDTGALLRADLTPFTGVAFELATTGELVCEVQYVRGVREGVAREYFPSGKLESQDTYRNGSKHGESWRWDTSGRKRMRAVYEYSILVESEEWDAGGNRARVYHLDTSSPQFRTLELMRKAYREGP